MVSKFKALMLFFKNIWLMTICYLPGDTGFYLRYVHWKKKLKHLGKNVLIDTGVYFQNPNYIHIDDNCWIDKNVMILAGMDKSDREKIQLKNKEYKGDPGVVYIGKNIHVGPGCMISGISAGVYISDDCCFSANCKLYAFSHHYSSLKNPGDMTIHFGSRGPQDRQCLIEGPIYLGKNTGVALNTVILPGASILDNCFVTINSVVGYGRIVANSIISGNPAKKIDDRFKG